MLARVSSIEAFRRWRLNEDAAVEELVRFITADEPNEYMLIGTAFHKAMEEVEEGAHETLSADGVVFFLEPMQIELPMIREVRAYRRYGELMVTGKCDALLGTTVIDHKTTWSAFDAESYLGGYQWRYYLDLFEADRFSWLVYRLSEMGPYEYRVAAPDRLDAYRYPELHADCARLAADYAIFAAEYLPAMEEPA